MVGITGYTGTIPTAPAAANADNSALPAAMMDVTPIPINVGGFDVNATIPDVYMAPLQAEPQQLPPHLQPLPQHLHPQPPHLEQQPPHLQQQPPYFQPQPSHLQSQAPHLQPQPPHLQSQPPHLQPQPQHLQPHPHHFQTQHEPTHMQTQHAPTHMQTQHVPTQMQPHHDPTQMQTQHAPTQMQTQHAPTQMQTQPPTQPPPVVQSNNSMIMMSSAPAVATSSQFATPIPGGGSYSVLQRARESGALTPSLLSEEISKIDPDGFELSCLNSLDVREFFLREDLQNTTNNFLLVLQKLEDIQRPDTLVVLDGAIKQRVLEYRRALVCAAVGATKKTSKVLTQILLDGTYLTRFKKWLDQILANPQGKIDLLLVLLSSLIRLPVTTAIVKDSGMGKAIGNISKHSVCAVGALNGNAIKDRVQQIKDAWQKSVKANKKANAAVKPTVAVVAAVPAQPVVSARSTIVATPMAISAVKSEKSSLLASVPIKSSINKNTTSTSIGRTAISAPKAPPSARSSSSSTSKRSTHGIPTKRSVGSRSSTSSSNSPSSVKKLKTTSLTSFSSLLKKVSGSPNSNNSSKSARGKLPVVAKAKPIKLESVTNRTTASSASKLDITAATKKKSGKRVKWADHFGNPLTEAQYLEGGEANADASGSGCVSWSDRKKRDRLREKELLLKVKKAKLLDDDDDDDLADSTMHVTVAWKQPAELPDRPEITPITLTSTEQNTQNERNKGCSKTAYMFEHDIPSSPFPLTDIEQGLDMTSQSSVTTVSIPFFASTGDAAADVAPVGNERVAVASVQHAPPPGESSGAATAEFVQSLGLPNFLVGQSIQALQSLASNRSLLATYVDATGQYEQNRLLALVQTLSAPQSSQPAVASSYNPAAAPMQTNYGASASYDQPPQPDTAMMNPPRPPSISFRTNSDEGNLHVSGYGPGATENDIIAAFAPYVQVDEVVLKTTFAFVNTSDPVNARRAKDALTGTLILGMPIKINEATRKKRDPAQFGNVNNFQQPPVPPPPSTYSAAPVTTYNNAPPPPGPPAGGGMYGNAAPDISTYGDSTHSDPYANGFPPAPGQSPQAKTPLNVEEVRDDRGNPATKNLFVAGYGSGVTEPQLRNLFSQFANVTGVILKGSFAFVNTTDKAAAVNAREMLGNSILHGGVLRVNFAKETGRLGTSFDLTYGVNTGPNAPQRRGNFCG